MGLAGSALAVSSLALASGLTVPFGAGVPALGEARGGGAAIAYDASTNYTNAAGLIRVCNDQFIASAFYTNDQKVFTGTMSNPGITIPFLPSGAVTQTGSNSTNISAIIPNFHYAHPINNRWTFGLSLLTPYGLGIHYPNDTLTRYEVMNATQKGIELSPSLAWAMTSQFSAGLGADILYYAIKAKTAVNLQPLASSDAILTNEAHSYNLGWHAGLLYQMNPCTRFGASYRSAMVTHNGGTSRMYVQNGLLIPNGMSTADNLRIVIPLAPLAIFSAYHDLTSRWAIMGSAEYEGWSIYKNDHAYNIAGPAGTTTASVITPTNYRNTWYFGLGTNYKWSDCILLRGGVDYVPSFVSRANRQILITDPSGYGVDVGFRYKQSPCYIWDFAATHSFYRTVGLNHTNPTTGDNLNGISHEDANSVGVQLTWNML